MATATPKRPRRSSTHEGLGSAPSVPPLGGTLTDEEIRRLERFRADGRFSVTDLLDAIDLVVTEGLSPTEILTEAAHGEQLWVKECKSAGRLEEKARAAAALLRQIGTPREDAQTILRGKLPSFELTTVLDSPSFQRELYFLILFHQMGHGGEIRAALHAVLDGILDSKVGDPGKGLRGALSDIERYWQHKRLHAAIRAAERSVPKDERDAEAIRSHLDPATSPSGQPWDSPDPNGDISRLLAANRRRVAPLPPKELAGVWLLELRRVLQGRSAPAPLDPSDDGVADKARLEIKRLKEAVRRFRRASRYN